MQPKPLTVYWLATRPFAFTASVIPVILGTVIAWVMTGQFNLLHALLAVLGGMTIHATANMVSDFYDLKKGLDRPYNFGAQNVLLKGWISPKVHRMEAIFMALISVAIAAFFVIQYGMFIFYLCLIGLLSALAYAIPPFNFKYIGLGDLQVFLSFGILMTTGAYYVQAGSFSWIPVLYAIPIGFLVDAILHSNNYRDIEGDKLAGVRTFAILIGPGGSLVMYYILVIGAYLSVLLMILFAGLTPFAFVTFLSLPVALKVLKKAAARTRLDQKEFGIIDIQTAQLHMMFGLLLTLGIAVSHFVRI